MPEHDVPLRTWRIENFKSIERAELALTNLNVIVGPNSSGKSSVLQSILVAAQAAQLRSLGSAFPLNGSLVQLGEFSDIKSAFAGAGKPVRLGGVFDLTPRPGTPDEARFRRVYIAGRKGYPEEGPLYLDWSLDLKGPAPQQPGAAEMRSTTFELRRDLERTRRKPLFRLEATKRRVLPSEEIYRVERIIAPARALYGPFESFVESAVFWSGQVRGADARDVIEGLTLVAGFPSMQLTKSRENRELARVWYSRLVAQSATNTRPDDERLGPQDLLVRLAEMATTDIREWLAQPTSQDVRSFAFFLRQRQTRSFGVGGRLLRNYPIDLHLFADIVVDLIGDEGREILVATPLPGDIYEQPVEILGGRVSYLGPLRQEPEVVYRRTSPVNARFLGIRGEFTAPALHSLRDERVITPLPGTPPGSASRVPLSRAMNEWLTFLEAATTIQTRDRGRLGYELVVTQPDLPRAVDLMSVGVGVSQVVPVLLVCLLTAPGDIILLEQPELHLHPAMQQRLGDFFIALARTGRQLIVETHSEYLMTRLRLRVAEDPTDTTNNLVAIFNTNRQGGRTVCRRIDVDSYGSIEDWPAGFFDQATEEAERLLAVGLGKRQRRRRPVT